MKEEEIMLHTQKWLKDHSMDFTSLTTEFGITVKDYGDRVVLNYSQINSPKTHPIVRECRGLILSKNNEVVCRPFDRFFNVGEAPETQSDLDMSRAGAFAKIDGSLIKMYNWGGNWELATRGSAFGENTVFDHNITFRQLALDALQLTEEEFQKEAGKLSPDKTYLFELTSPLNRCVTPYSDTTMWFLGARSNVDTEYKSSWWDKYCVSSVFHCVVFPDVVPFTTVEDAVKAANSLGGLQEGYVLWQDGIPVCKIKADAYVTAHRIRGEGLTERHICELILIGEEGEYLTYFPIERKFFTPYIEALESLLDEIETTWQSLKEVGDQKEFAVRVKELPYSSVLFSARKSGKSPTRCFHESRMEWKTGILKEMVRG